MNKDFSGKQLEGRDWIVGCRGDFSSFTVCTESDARIIYETWKHFYPAFIAKVEMLSYPLPETKAFEDNEKAIKAERKRQHQEANEARRLANLNALL